MSLSPRYEGKPILLVIESYALAVLGELDESKAAAVRDVVNRVWGGGDDWMQTVRTRFGWTPSTDDGIRQNWESYQNAAREQGVPGSAAEFSMAFADAVEKDASSKGSGTTP